MAGTKEDSLMDRMSKSTDSARVDALNDLSRYFRSSGEYVKSRNYAEQALELAISLKYKKGVASGYSLLGLISKAEGDYSKALEYLFSALRLWEQLNDSIGIANMHNNLGNIYFDLENYDDALKSHQSALVIRQKCGDKKGIATSYNNMGNVYMLKGDFEQSLKCHEASLAIRLELNNPAPLSESYNNIGNIYTKKGDYPMALSYYMKSLELNNLINDPAGIASTNVNVGQANMKLGNYEKARESFDITFNLGKKLGSKRFLMQAYGCFAELDSITGDYKDAYRNYQLYIIYRDSLVNEENKRKQTQLAMQYQFDKQQEADKLKHEQQIQQQKLYTYGGMIGAVLMLVVAGVSFRAYRQKRKDNQTITEQKLLVEQKQREILDSIHYAKRIQQSLMPTEKYLEKNLNKNN